MPSQHSHPPVTYITMSGPRHSSSPQVVHCVMANAFKYTRKGGVTMSTEESADGQYLTFRVVDTGTGFSKEQVHAGRGQGLARRLRAQGCIRVMPSRMKTLGLFDVRLCGRR